MNALRCCFAWCVIYRYSVLGKLRELFGYSRPRIEHYAILRFFQRFWTVFFVQIAYPSPLTGQPITLWLNLCKNTDLCYFRARERYECSLLMRGRSLIRQTGANTFVDVGANLGIWSLTLAQAMPSVRVVAIDPVKAHLIQLNTSADEMGLTKIETLHGVCSNLAGVTTFYDNPFNNGDGSLVLEQIKSCSQVTPETKIRPRQVTSYCLDDLLVDATVAKIDVQGAEVQVLYGAMKSLQDGRLRGIICEIQREHRAAIHKLFREYPQWTLEWQGGPEIYTLIAQRA